MFLVKHSYVSGWHLPGGGVETGETFMDSLKRELVEEGRIELTGEPELHGLYFNRKISPRDHVAVYVVREFIQDRAPEPNREIIACGFFAMSFAMIVHKLAGTSGLSSRIGCGVSSTTRFNTANVLAARNGG